MRVAFANSQKRGAAYRRLVTGIVAFGTDLEVYYAVPLGVFAGALAMFFVSLSEAQDTYKARWEQYKVASG